MLHHGHDGGLAGGPLPGCQKGYSQSGLAAGQVGFATSGQDQRPVRDSAYVYVGGVKFELEVDHGNNVAVVNMNSGEQVWTCKLTNQTPPDSGASDEEEWSEVEATGHGNPASASVGHGKPLTRVPGPTGQAGSSAASLQASSGSHGKGHGKGDEDVIVIPPYLYVCWVEACYHQSGQATQSC